MGLIKAVSFKTGRIMENLLVNGSLPDDSSVSLRSFRRFRQCSRTGRSGSCRTTETVGPCHDGSMYQLVQFDPSKMVRGTMIDRHAKGQIEVAVIERAVPSHAQLVAAH